MFIPYNCSLQNVATVIYKGFVFSCKKNENFIRKNLDIVSYFCSKYRLWIYVRITSPRRFYEVRKTYVLEKNKGYRYTPAYPCFAI